MRFPFPKIFFRADGNSQIGLGHVFRSLALAKMLSKDFDCHFMIRNPSDSLRRTIEDAGLGLTQLSDTISLEKEAEYISKKFLTGKELVVLDGYHFVTKYQGLIRAKAKSLVCIDDIHTCHFLADAIINHTNGIDKNDYEAEAYTQFYLGMKYALLRKPFRDAAKGSRPLAANMKQIFVCLGGADPHNDTLGVLKQLESASYFQKCMLVIGSAYQYKKELEAYMAEARRLEIAVFSNLNADQMCSLMQECGVGITPPSSVSYEYLSVGGLLYLQKIATNQNKVYDYLVSNQMAYPFDRIDHHPDIVKKHKGELVKNIFDGQQAMRFRQIFHDLLG